jgi:hypothetical protein
MILKCLFIAVLISGLYIAFIEIVIKKWLHGD